LTRASRPDRFPRFAPAPTRLARRPFVSSVSLADFLIVAPVLLFSMVAHEYAHGYAAFKQGDMTAYQLGRLTWNPAKHIDPFMTVILPVMLWAAHQPIFGGAKPVPVNPRNYRNFKRGDIIVSLAGIATNLALAVVLTLIAIPLGLLGRALPAAETTFAILQLMMVQGIGLNLLLAFFNLLPLPPLDGSHVMKYLLPPALAIRYVALGRVGFLLLFLLLSFAPGVLRTWLTPAFLLEGIARTLIGPFLLPTPRL
jgi:Zn-dependent protease